METSLGIQKMIAKTKKDDKDPPIVLSSISFSQVLNVSFSLLSQKKEKMRDMYVMLLFLKKCRLWRRKKKQQT